MPSIIISPAIANRIAGTSSLDLTTEQQPGAIILNQTEFDALPDNVVSCPHNWNSQTRMAEIVFDLATCRTQAIEDLRTEASGLLTGRFQSNALATMYDYDSDQLSLFRLVSASISRQASMITTFTGDTPTDLEHTNTQINAVIRSFFDHVTGIDTRLRTAESAVNAATDQATIDAVML